MRKENKTNTTRSSWYPIQPQTVTALSNSGLCPCSNTAPSHVPPRLSAQGQTDHTSTGDLRFQQPATDGSVCSECRTAKHNRHFLVQFVSNPSGDASNRVACFTAFSQKKIGGGGNTSVRKRLQMLRSAQCSSCCGMVRFMWQASIRRMFTVPTVKSKSVLGLSRIRYFGQPCAFSGERTCYVSSL
jgi:hypothetical protein